MREKYKDTVSYIVDGVDIQLDKEYGNKGTVLGISGVDNGGASATVNYEVFFSNWKEALKTEQKRETKYLDFNVNFLKFSI